MKPWRSTFIANSLIALLGLISGVVVARVLGVEDRGALAAVIYWPHLLAGIFAMGLNEGIVIRTSRQGERFSTLSATTLMISLQLACIVGLLSWFLLPVLMADQRSEYTLVSQIYLMVFLPLTYLAQNFLAIEQGEQKFKLFNVHRILQAAIYPLMLGVFWVGDVLTVELAAVSALAGTATVALLRVGSVRAKLWRRPSISEARELLALSLPLHAVNLVVFVSQQADRIILMLLASNYVLGLYVVAFTVASAFGNILIQTYINIMLPTAARVGLSSTTIQGIISPLRHLVAIIWLSTVVLVLAVPSLTVFVFGEEFADSGFYAQILTLGFAFIGIKKALVYLLRSWGENRMAFSAEFITTFLIIVGSYLALTMGGVTEVCLVVAGAHMASCIFVVYSFLDKTGLSLKQFTGLAPVGA